jgi:hypothetical protein
MPDGASLAGGVTGGFVASPNNDSGDDWGVGASEDDHGLSSERPRSCSGDISSSDSFLHLQDHSRISHINKERSKRPTPFAGPWGGALAFGTLRGSQGRATSEQLRYRMIWGRNGVAMTFLSSLSNNLDHPASQALPERGAAPRQLNGPIHLATQTVLLRSRPRLERNVLQSSLRSDGPSTILRS